MGYVCDKEFINFDCLENELNRIKSLICVVSDNFFQYSPEQATMNALAIITCDYEKYQDLIAISLGLLKNMGETLQTVKENYEGGE